MPEPIGSVPIPKWEIAQLESLSGAGQLSGVNPLDLALIDQAESSGSGGGINSSGYGGWFGLGVGKQYPTGSINAATMRSTSPQAFDQQASVAAGEFASLLGQHGGNPVRAEMAYQGGSTEGASIFEKAGIAANDPQTGYNTSATQTANSSGGGGLFGIDLNPVDWLTGLFKPLVTGIEDFTLSLGFILVGLVLIAMALLYFIFKGNSAARNAAGGMVGLGGGGTSTAAPAGDATAAAAAAV